MKALTPYLNFDGNTNEVMTFYARCLDATLSVQTFGDVNMDQSPEGKDRVVHARLEKGTAVLMASDTQVGNAVHRGDDHWLNVECSSPEEQTKIFSALVEGGKSLMDLQDTFWGARFGMLKDKYGVNWMFNFEQPKSA